MVEVSCTNCGQQIFMNNEHVREQMFCTLGCMTRFKEKEKERFKDRA